MNRLSKMMLLAMMLVVTLFSCEEDEKFVVGEITDITTKTSDGYYLINWTAISNADTYKLIVDEDEPMEFQTNSASLAMQTIESEGKIALGNHALKLEAYSGTKLLAEAASQISVVDTLLNINSFQDMTTFKISWDTCALVTNYTIKVDDQDTKSDITAGECTLSFVTSANPDGDIEYGKHNFVVEGFNADGIKIMQTSLTANLAEINIDVPKNISVSTVGDSVLVAWDNVDGADGYQLFINNVKSQKSEDYVVEMVEGQEYKAIVKRTAWEKGKAVVFTAAALEDKKQGPVSEDASFTPETPITPVDLLVTAELGTCALAWNVEDNDVATSFEITMNGEVVSNVSLHLDSIKNLDPAFYTFSIRGISALGVKSLATGEQKVVLREGTNPLPKPYDFLRKTTGWGPFKMPSVTVTWKNIGKANMVLKYVDGNGNELGRMEVSDTLARPGVSLGEFVYSKAYLADIESDSAWFDDIYELRVYSLDSLGNEQGYDYIPR
jgi:hypothetical protein